MSAAARDITTVRIMILIPSDIPLKAGMRIKAKLAAKYYSPALISKTIRSLEERGEIDFKKQKEALLSTKLDNNAAYEEKMKLLYKYGYLK